MEELRPSRARRFGRVATLVAILAAIALVSVPAAGTWGIGNGLVAFVRVTNPGPLPACSGPDCTGANRVDNFIYVANLNRLTDLTGRAQSRATIPNSFVVNSVEMRLFIDGVESGPPTMINPPPNPTPFRSWAGHWPATVNCPPGSDPCNVVTNPAVVPGEVTSVVYAGWVHGDTEPNGTHVFKFTVRGTLEGMPVELRANSQPIEMTD
jgi:hypothetical protein